MNNDDFFLSTENPLANVDQRDVEDRALNLVKRPEFQKARAVAAHLWLNVVGNPARDQMSRFDDMIDEYTFHHALWAANSDAHHPRVVHVQAPPHHWFGRDLPGSRWGGESPDVIYRMIPIEHGGSYELRGRVTSDEPPMALYSLMSEATAAPITQGMIDSFDMVTDANGMFAITIDATAAEGRTNHLQTKPDTEYLNIRDILGDWLTQTPNALLVRRLNSSSRPPLIEEVVERQTRKMLEGVYFAYYCSMSGSNLPLNEMRAPVSSAITAGLTNQVGTKANLCIADDEALIVTTNPAGARFRNAVLQDVFSLSMDYGAHTTSLNMTQVALDDDGLVTFVVAHRDPGVHNWLDTCGLHRTIFGHRWQSFPPEGPIGTPTIATQLVKFSDLEGALKPGVRRLDTAGRIEQLARRAAGFNRRFIDH